MAYLVDKSLGRYHIQTPLGKGGMGAVFKAFDSQLERQVAIKVMKPELAQQIGFQARFEREAQITAKFNRSDIVQIYDYGQDLNCSFIVMEFIPGGNLYAILQSLRGERRWLSVTEATKFMVQVSSALGYAHQRGVYHLDIKPQNIMIKPEPASGLPYRPAITDLGLARLDKGDSSRDADIAGTGAYMSPEQALGKGVDARSDVYALGVLLFELLIGEYLFDIDSLREARRFHRENERKGASPPLPVILSILPQELAAIVKKASARLPDDRFKDADQLAQELSTALIQLPVEMGNETVAPFAVSGVDSLFDHYQKTVVPEAPMSNKDPGLTEEDIFEHLQADLPPNFGIALEPKTQENELAGRFHLKVDNRSTADLNMHLEAHSRDETCQCILDLQQTVVPAGQMGRVNIQTEAPFAVAGRKQHIFTVLAYEVEAPGVVRHVQGEWIQPPLDFELTLQPIEQRGIGEGHFALQVANRSNIDLTLRLETIDTVEGCRYALDRNLILVRAHKEEMVSLFVEPDTSSSQESSRIYPFTIIARPEAVPQITRKVQGQWIQIRPDLGLALHSVEQRHVKTGKFTLAVSNQSDIDLTIQLEATDAEGVCAYVFGLSDVVVVESAHDVDFTIQSESDVDFTIQLESAVSEGDRTYAINLAEIPVCAHETRYLTLDAMAPSFTNARIDHHFTITAYAVQAPEVTRLVSGTWEQTHPDLGLALIPGTSIGQNQGLFQIRLQNRDQAELDIQLSAIDSEPGCFFVFDPSHVTVPPDSVKTVGLNVQTTTPYGFNLLRNHRFRIVASFGENPITNCEVTGLWRRTLPVWKYVVIVIFLVMLVLLILVLFVFFLV